MRRTVSAPVLVVLHTVVQIVAALLVVALSFALSPHDARKLDGFVALAQIVGTVGYANVLQRKVLPTSLGWPAVIALTLVSGVVSFVLTYYLGAFASDRSRDDGWAVVTAGLAAFQLVVSLRMFTAARQRRA